MKEYKQTIKNIPESSSMNSDAPKYPKLRCSRKNSNCRCCFLVSSGSAYLLQSLPMARIRRYRILVQLFGFYLFFYFTMRLWIVAKPNILSQKKLALYLAILISCCDFFHSYSPSVGAALTATFGCR